MKTPVQKRRKSSFTEHLPKTLHSSFVGEFTSLIDVDLNEAPLHRDLSFKFTYLAKMWLSKYSDTTTTSASDRKKAAISKWQLAESRNQKTNERLLFDETTFNGGITSQQITKFARMVIRQTIGDSPPSDILLGEFTNGASTRVSRGPDAIARKFVGEAHATPEAWELFKTKVLPSSLAWTDAMMSGAFRHQESHGSMMFTVPKNSEIDRVACKEPEINMYLQRGAGLYLRSALRKRGINLQDQTQNQRLALEGSISDKLATLDLSSASDLISTQLVYNLLPMDWFLLLDAIRVKRTLIGNEWHELCMFSSMGNGFTFELESLIFYALSCAINRAYRIRGRISVYGDDIITPSAIAGAYSAIFAWFGFVVNTKKSFVRGPFRESCGKHYYKGADVTPFFLRARISTLRDLIHQLNQLRVWSTRNGDDFWSPKLSSFWSNWSKRVPSFLYGGKNPADKSCLCTTHRPRKRLTASKRETGVPQYGAYLHWLHTADNLPRREIRLQHGDSATTLQKRVVAFAWLDEYERREPLVTSQAFLEHDIVVSRNRERDGSLNQFSWFQELAVMAAS